MSRFYYPACRSHHAYVMAVDFGMEFANRFGKWQRESLVHLTGATGYRLYVHEDSLGLLEPRVGDVVETTISYRCVRVYGIKTEEGYRFSGGEVLPASRCHSTKIIQRQGVPFYYPDQEPA